MVSPSQPPDPIVEEVRAARDAIARTYDYDIDRIAEAVRAREQASAPSLGGSRREQPDEPER